MDRININAHKIRSNAKHGRREPVIRIQSGRAIAYADSVEILDRDGNVAATVVYSPERPMKCGAKVWINCPYGSVILRRESKEDPLVGCANEEGSGEQSTTTGE